MDTEKIVHNEKLSDRDVIVTMGAGDITKLSTLLASKPYLR
jgi:UDP-N-acetylmuramate-alanine ligase